MPVFTIGEDEFRRVLSYVAANQMRRDVLDILDGGIRMPSSIRDDLDVQLSHVSRALKQLAAMELVECLAPGQRKGRLYGITPKGKVIIHELLKEENRALRRAGELRDHKRIMAASKRDRQR
jgi:ArsR family transcriptional regulator, cadmium/lead-responsive transcriptional repressor